MNVIEPGHIYELNQLDGEGNPQRLTFVNREEGTEHPGTQTQEVLRMTIDMMECLVDRTNHCDACLRWEGNDRIIKALTEAKRQMRLAIIFHEQRVLERKMAKDEFEPEKAETGQDGHFTPPPSTGRSFNEMWAPLRLKRQRQVKLSVNGREHTTIKEQLSYGDIVDMLYGPVHPTPTRFTMTYFKGPPPQTEGILEPGGSVSVADGMSITVADTSMA